MSKKHYEAIAASIRKQVEAAAALDAEGNTDSERYARSLAAKMAVHDLALDLADYFGSINPNFKRDKFLKACGI